MSLDQRLSDRLLQVYREPQVRDEEAYKGEDVDGVTPFGEVFQQEKQFEEDVFEPECPYGDEEKTFMQQHPLFGDFGVKTVCNPDRERESLRETV